METDILLESLDMFLHGKSGDVKLKADELRRVLTRVKSLECALADVLRLVHETGKLAS